MRIVHISDTHGNHTNFTKSLEELRDCDVLVHSGDFSHYGIPEETDFFIKWLRSQPFQHKILIAGNHDDAMFKVMGHEEQAFNLDGIHYLVDDSVEIEGMKIYGAPWTPSVFGGSFTYYPEDGDEHWQKIPDDVDVLITHGPMFGCLDLVEKYDATKRLGCKALAELIEELSSLKAHLFGHIHQARGMKTIDDVQFSNAATTINVIEV